MADGANGVAGPHRLSELRGKGPETARITAAGALDDRPRDEAVRGQAVEDRSFGETRGARHLRIGVEWVGVTGQPIKQRLLPQRRFLVLEQRRLAVGHLGRLALRRM